MHLGHSPTLHPRPSPAKQAPRRCAAQPPELCGGPAQQGEAVADLPAG